MANWFNTNCIVPNCLLPSAGKKASLLSVPKNSFIEWPSQLPTKQRQTLGNVNNVCLPTSSVVQQMSLPVKEPKKILRKDNKRPTRVAVGHTTESETYPVLLPVEGHNNPTHLKAIQMFPLLVTQLQEASSSLLQLDNSYLPTEEEFETISNSPFSKTDFSVSVAISDDHTSSCSMPLLLTEEECCRTSKDLCVFLVHARPSLSSCANCKSLIVSSELLLPNDFTESDFTRLRNKNGLIFVSIAMFKTVRELELLIQSHFSNPYHFYVVETFQHCISKMFGAHLMEIFCDEHRDHLISHLAME